MVITTRSQMTKEIESLSGDENVPKHFPHSPVKDCLSNGINNYMQKMIMEFQPHLAGCMSVRDIVTSGYIITNAFEQEIIGNTFDPDNVEQVEKVYPRGNRQKFLEIQNP